eukprot:TRINITY_DN15092_c0_g2_i5.p1 TRINITY_DN15092_c0_g2~~TRINITY_DN15092_c0_g2_i5.p1  ORF type:complete len:288 (-),score=65.13 TRINITY_DN15092_c0_g2_i5:101-964(-)
MANVSPMQNNGSQSNLNKEVLVEEISGVNALEESVYDKVLGEIKESCESLLVQSIAKLRNASSKDLSELKESLVSERMRNEKLARENTRLAREHENQCALINSQKELIKELKRKLTEESLVSEMKFKAENLAAEIDKLQKENIRLEALVKDLSIELGQFKVQDPNVMNIAKKTAFIGSCSEPFSAKENNVPKPSRSLLSNELNRTASQSKLKPKKLPVIPKLDLSKLPQKERAQLKVIPCEDPNSLDSNLTSHDGTFYLACIREIDKCGGDDKCVYDIGWTVEAYDI